MTQTPAASPERDQIKADTEPLRPISERLTAPPRIAAPVALHGLTWRELRHSDLTALLEFERAVDEADDPDASTDAEDLEERFDTPGFTPATDTIIALTPGGAIVAYGEAYLEASGEGIVTAHINGRVHPEWRRKGLGTQLLRWQAQRGTQQLAASPLQLPAMMSTLVGEHAAGQRALFEAEGFRPARWWIEMERDLEEAVPAPALAPGLRVEPFTSQWSGQARLAINESFRDHWGSQPTSHDEWDDAKQADDFRASWSAVAIATHADGTEEVVGAITVEGDEDEWESYGYRFGNVDELGVTRAWRGRGIASALLSSAMRAMRADGVERATLDVDSDSPTGANALYAKLGFAETGRSVTYAKTF
ncbi:GNAT family N-acetyltransferase [Leucobacter albus]|uniref:GNAT family N-acetyltransferase n=1 Tax=Leucobacter albus TaxID=272210 RepID=A0ABW3TM04_9MICO